MRTWSRVGKKGQPTDRGDLGGDDGAEEEDEEESNLINLKR